MNGVPLFDANCCLGENPALTVSYRTAVELEAALDRLGIGEALVYHSLALHYSPALGNQVLLEALQGHPRLHPCWLVLPQHTGELPPGPTLAREMRQRGVRAARLCPKRVGPLRPYVFAALLACLQDQAIPLLLDFELGHWGNQATEIDWDGLDWMLREYPGLPVVLLRPGQGIERALLPLLEQHDNLYVETSYYMAAGALERLCARIGPERLVFGTGMPVYAPGPAITLLTYSDLAQEAKAMVGAGSLRRLLGLAQAC